jgi:hypothetical protein
MSGEATSQRRDATTAASGADLATRYRGARARLMRPIFWERPSCGPACWLPELIAFNEDMRRLFLRATRRAAMPLGERVREIVAAHYRLTRAEIIGAHSNRRISWPRQVAMYICARHAGLRSRDIAVLFGDRDLSTVRSALRGVAARQSKQPAVAAEIAALIAKCRLGGTA